MTGLVPITRERHGGKKWRRFSDYGFAANQAMAPLAGAELGQAALSMPLAFVERAGRFVLVAVLSLTPDRNMFVAPDGGWLGAYVPAWFRAHPFHLLLQQGTGAVVLCMDEANGLAVEGDFEGEDFFAEGEDLSPALRAVFDFLAQVERGRKAIDLAVSALREAGVIRPWPIKVRTEQGEQAVGGLNRIDEAALNAVEDEVLLRLRTSGALPVAYAQMLSAGQLGVFERLAKLHHLAAPPAAALPESIDSLFGMLGGDMVRF